MEKIMEKLKNMTKVQKVIAGVLSLALVIGVSVAIIVINSDTVNNKDIDPIENEIVIKLEYGAELDKDTFTITDSKKGKDVVVEINDINTKKMGKTEYTAKSDDGIIKVNIVIQDTKPPVIKGKDEYKTPFTKDFSVKAFLNKSLTATDPVDGELMITYDFEPISKPGKYEIKAKASDINGNKVEKTISLELTEEAEEDEVDKEEPTESDKPTGSTGNKDNSHQGIPTIPEPKPSEKDPVVPDKEDKPTDKPNNTKPAPEEGSSNVVANPVPNPNVPAGSVITEQIKGDNAEDIYSYSRTLSDGASINRYIYRHKHDGVSIFGLDVNGQRFNGMIYSDNPRKIYYSITSPTITRDALGDIFSFAEEVFTAYGH